MKVKDIRQCDICGEKYEFHEINREMDDENINFLVVFDELDEDIITDLCSRCRRELEDYFIEQIKRYKISNNG